MLKRFLRDAARKVGLISLIKRFNFHRAAQVRGVKIRTPVVAGMHSDPNEGWMVGLLERLIPLIPGAFIDVGANKGDTLMIVKALDPNSHCLCIEPNPNAVFYINRLIAANNFLSTKVVAVAAFDRAALLSLNFPGEAGLSTNPAASLLNDFRTKKKSEKILVPCFELDEIVTSLGEDNVGIVKIDAEGAELEVLRGMKRTIARCRPIVIFEALPTGAILEREQRQMKFVNLLSAAQYKIFRIIRSGSSFPGLIAIEKCGATSPDRHFDYVGVPAETVSCLV